MYICYLIFNFAMRKLLFLFLVSLVAVSCDDTELNTPVIQGEVDNQFYRSRAQAAVDDNEKLIIRGSELDVISLRVNGNTPGVYPITSTSNTVATFLRDGQLFVTSGPNTGGEIVIDKKDEFGVSGSFFFNARLNGVGRMITFSRGVFFDIPFLAEGFDVEIELPDLPGDGEGE